MSKLKQLFPNHNLGDKHDYEKETNSLKTAIDSLNSLLEANGVDKDLPNTYTFKKL